MLKDDIIKLIKLGANDQNELQKKLTELGYSLTQSSISRKLKQFGIVKISGQYQIEQNKKSTNLDIAFAEPNLFVIRTSPGHAASTASLIDKELVENTNHPEFLGTIAGDDTIFVAVNLEYQNHSLAQKKLRELIL